MTDRNHDIPIAKGSSHEGAEEKLITGTPIIEANNEEIPAAGSKPVTHTDGSPYRPLIILSLPVFIALGHLVYLENFLDPAAENQRFVTVSFYLFGAFGSAFAVWGGLIAAYISYSDRWRKRNFLGAALRFASTVFGFYTLYIGVIYSHLIV